MKETTEMEMVRRWAQTWKQFAMGDAGVRDLRSVSTTAAFIAESAILIIAGSTYSAS